MKRQAVLGLLRGLRAVDRVLSRAVVSEIHADRLTEQQLANLIEGRALDADAPGLSRIVRIPHLGRVS